MAANGRRLGETIRLPANAEKQNNSQTPSLLSSIAQRVAQSASGLTKDLIGSSSSAGAGATTSDLASAHANASKSIASSSAALAGSTSESASHSLSATNRTEAFRDSEHENLTGANHDSEEWARQRPILPELGRFSTQSLDLSDYGQSIYHNSGKGKQRVSTDSDHVWVDDFVRQHGSDDDITRVQATDGSGVMHLLSLTSIDTTSNKLDIDELKTLDEPAAHDLFPMGEETYLEPQPLDYNRTTGIGSSRNAFRPDFSELGTDTRLANTGLPDNAELSAHLTGLSQWEGVSSYYSDEVWNPSLAQLMEGAEVSQSLVKESKIDRSPDDQAVRRLDATMKQLKSSAAG